MVAECFNDFFINVAKDIIVLFIIFVNIGFAITGLASFNNLADIPSLPVAFLTLVLFICLCTNSSDISLNSRLGISCKHTTCYFKIL
jgi:hypothetical protein